MKAKNVGLFTMALGALGIVIPLLVLVGDSSVMVQVGVMVSGAIIFGCGAIATVMALNK